MTSATMSKRLPKTSRPEDPTNTTRYQARENIVTFYSIRENIKQQNIFYISIHNLNAGLHISICVIIYRNLNVSTGNVF